MPLQPTAAPQPTAASAASTPDAEQDGYGWGTELALPLRWPGDDA